jgi:hypothetical protein
VFLWGCLAAGIAAVEGRYRHGHWWDAAYCTSLLIPLLLFPAIVCAMFVPRQIQWSGAEFQIQTRFGRVHTLPWDRLYAYGSGNNVFVIQFRDVGAFQIFAGAFKRDEWLRFRSFLTVRFPQKKALMWVGPYAIRRNSDAN